MLQRQAWKVAEQLGWETTSNAEFVALTILQADALVTADAEHCQRAHARFLVYEKDADYLVLATGNQPSLEALAQSQLPGGFSPSVRHA